MENKYTFLQPDYYKNFKCSGSDCKINCCSYNWKINVDKNTYLKYRSIKEPKYFVDLLNKYVKKDRTNQNVLSYAKVVHKKELTKINYTTIEDGVEKEVTEDYYNILCPFQDELGLCEIHKNLGNEGLCSTCKNYPRIVNNIFNNYERGMAIGCEEVSKLLYSLENGISFEIVEDETSITSNYFVDLSKVENPILNHFDDIRLTCIQILQLRELSIDDRIILLGIFMFKIDELHKNNNLNDIPSYIETFFDNISLYEKIFNINSKRQDILLEMIITFLNSQNVLGTKDLTLDLKELLLKLFKAYIDTSSDNDISSIYEDYKQNYINLMKDSEYFIENIFVNLFFNSGYPFNGTNSVKECCILFIFNYICYKSLLAGFLGDKNELDLDLLHKISVIWSRSFADQYGKLSEILEVIKDNDMDNLAFLAVLIKSA